MKDILSEYPFSQIPFDDIQRVGQLSLLNRDLFCVSWLLGRFCNYKCSYCWPYARSSIPDHRPLALLIQTMNEIKKQARERNFNSFHFSFSGGEPTLHKGYLQLLEHYSQDVQKSNYQSIHMTSNLSPGFKWFENYIQSVSSLHRVSITASFHKEHAQRDVFADKIKFLQENEIHITINMVMVPDRFEELWEDALYFHKREINVTLKPQSDSKAQRVVEGYTKSMLEKLREGLPQKDYTAMALKKKDKKSSRPKQSLPLGKKRQNFQLELTDSKGKAWYMDQAERLNAFNFNRFKNWECSAGYRSLIIREPDGFIKRSYSCFDKPLGHIEEGFKLLSCPKTCITDSCVSSADSKIPKRKKKSSLPLWPQFVSQT
ncbi:MAG: radical SAM protein [Bdellovibrionales bacterium]|nr:radical SAM protein [Bdellovibrionales bacterium]